MFHPSPSSVLDVSTTKAPLDVNDLNGSVKEKVNVETNGEDGGIDVEPVYSEDNSILHLQQQQQQRLIPLGGVGYMDQLPP